MPTRANNDPPTSANPRSGYIPITTCSPHNNPLITSHDASATFDYRSPTCVADIKSPHPQLPSLRPRLHRNRGIRDPLLRDPRPKWRTIREAEAIPGSDGGKPQERARQLTARAGDVRAANLDGRRVRSRGRSPGEGVCEAVICGDGKFDEEEQVDDTSGQESWSKEPGRVSDRSAERAEDAENEESEREEVVC